MKYSATMFSSFSQCFVRIFLSFLIFSFILVDNSNLDIPDIEQKVKDMSKH